MSKGLHLYEYSFGLALKRLRKNSGDSTRVASELAFEMRQAKERLLAFIHVDSGSREKGAV